MKHIKPIIAISGYSGSGKSILSKLLKQRGYQVVSVSRTFKKFLSGCTKDFYSLPEKDRLARGMEFIRKDPLIPGKLLYERTVNLHKKDPKSTIVIDGIRCMRDLHFFNKEKFQILFIYSSFPVRLHRIKNKRKENITKHFLKKRDLIDISVGLGRVIKNSDILIVNDNNLSKEDLNNLFLSLEKKNFSSFEHGNIFKTKNIPMYILKEIKRYETEVKRIGK